MMVPEATKTNLEAVFLDNAELTIDAKFRVGIPERFMKVLRSLAPDCSDRVGVIPTPNHSLKLLPYPDFVKRVEWWRSLNDQFAAHRTIKTLETSLAKELTMDNQNRIRLTPAQIKFCKIKRDILMIGGIDCIQIWDPGVFEEMIKREAENFAAASEEVARQAAGIQPPVQQFVIEAHPRAMA
jgi:division/cell wall cluster transcriptional repressor MraZ